MTKKQAQLRLYAARRELKKYQAQLKNRGATLLSQELDKALTVELLTAPVADLQIEIFRIDRLLDILSEPQSLPQIIERERNVIESIKPVLRARDIQDLDRLSFETESTPSEIFSSKSPEHFHLDYASKLPGITAKNECALIEVFYATSRDHGESKKPNFFYSNRRSEDNALKAGTVNVSIPLKGRKKGEIPRPKMWKFEFRENQSQHVMLRDIKELNPQDFFNKLAKRANKLQRKIGLVYIHGYNVSFAQAARRTAQLAFDLFPLNEENEENQLTVVPILFSWPSSGRVLKYSHDSTASEASAGHLRRLLENIAAKSGLKEITVLAHSMGSRPLVMALEKLAVTANSTKLLKNILLAAPDVDRDVFLEAEAKLKETCSNITMYASRADFALHASRAFINGFVRLGDASNEPVIFGSGDTIDATVAGEDMLGHSYYGNRTILTDIFSIMKNSLAPKERFGLIERSLSNGKYWEMT